MQDCNIGIVLPGKVDDNRKEEQCIYKNGANFKITSGTLVTGWIEKVSDIDNIHTNLRDTVLNICPSNLRYGSLGPLKAKTLEIRKVSAAPEAGPKNLF